MPGKILITGGKGKTGSRVSALLQQQGIAHRIGTRHPEAANEIAFDWMRPERAENALTGVEALYIVAPTNSTDHGTIVPPVLEMALEKGVRRFVLLSASPLVAGAPMMGQIHAWLAANAPEWVVLCPAWFMQNFYEQRHLVTIQEENAICSATGNGKIGFIGVSLDIEN